MTVELGSGRFFEAFLAAAIEADDRVAVSSAIINASVFIVVAGLRDEPFAQRVMRYILDNDLDKRWPESSGADLLKRALRHAHHSERNSTVNFLQERLAGFRA